MSGARPEGAEDPVPPVAPGEAAGREAGVTEVAERVTRGWRTTLLPLLLVVLGAHLAVRAALPLPSFFGDESQYYLRHAKTEAEAGRYSLLPGTLTFDHRLGFLPRVYAHLRAEGSLEGTFRNIEAFHILLALLSVVLLWYQSRLLGLSPIASAFVGGVVGLFPWQAFHVHSLWPETLHTFLLALCIALLLAAFRRGRIGGLLPAGVVLGFALLTKAVMQPLAPLFAVLIAAASWRRQGARRALAGAGLFLAGLALVVTPQLVRNARDGHGAQLSANRWWNIELGVTPLPRVSASRVRDGLASGYLQDYEVRWLPHKKRTLAYMAAAETPAEREALARERTLEYVREKGLPQVALDQTEKFAHTVAVDVSCFERSVAERHRWGEPSPTWLALLRWPSRVFWWGLLALSAVGLVRTRCQTAGWCLVAFVLAHVCAAVFLVPMKFRFFLPALPFLALLAAEPLDALLRRARGRSGPEPHTHR